MTNVASRINNEPLQELSQTLMSEKTENQPLSVNVLYKIKQIVHFYLYYVSAVYSPSVKE